MTKAKKLIEVAMPIKEISAESVRDKSIRHGHISTLHLWWARRPLPVCRAVIFASLVPDPLDENCPKAFADAVELLLGSNRMYEPYKDIPYTAGYDPMEDNLRNRLMMFVGKFSDRYQQNAKEGKTTSPADQLTYGSLIKWESKNNKETIDLAQKLIWVAYNADLCPEKSYRELVLEFDFAKERIAKAEDELYSFVNRHKESEQVSSLENNLKAAIDAFQSKMPLVFDPFAGGGAIPLEAARLGCRSYGNDINPVAHIIEKGSAEFPQRYGKPLSISKSEFSSRYGQLGIDILELRNIGRYGDTINIPNRLLFDIEYYAKSILLDANIQLKSQYPNDDKNQKPVAYYWVRTAICENPSCKAEVPMLRQFYLANTNRKVYLNPIINGNEIDFEIINGTYNEKSMPGWNKTGNLICPCCGSVTTSKQVKNQAVTSGLGERLVAIIVEGKAGKEYKKPHFTLTQPEIESSPFIPTEKMVVQSDLISSRGWGISSWYQMFSPRQLNTISRFIDNFNALKDRLGYNDYNNALYTYIALWLDRIILANTSLSRWHTKRETLEHPFSKQAIAMVFDYPESNPFCYSSGSALNQLDWILRYLDSESNSQFSAEFANASSGEKSQFMKDEVTAAITDPPYYDAIAYADISDFFYVWMKRTIGDIYPENFSTPQTPKSEECTALKHHHGDSEVEAKKHFENKLTQIFDAIETQTKDIVSIMFAHQSTEAWTTLCNSIIDARMNITGSWPMDTEMASRTLAIAGAALESSVTVSCRPSERKGFGDYKDVKKAIAKKVEEEVNYLYNLGFRGADLLTACFGQAVSEFGKYQIVEKADGSEVQVSELLEMARESAFDALLKGVQGDDFTRFYVGWLQLNGMGETDFDDVTKFTRVGLNVNITDIFAKKLLIRNGKSQHLATAEEHVGGNQLAGMNPGDILIEQVHRAILLYKAEYRGNLLNQLKRIHAEDITAPFWRLLASLKELLPANDDLKQVQGLLANGDDLRQSCKNYDENKQEQLSFDF